MTDSALLAFKEAIRIVEASITDPRCGPASAIAKLVGCTRQAAGQVLHRGSACPARWVVPLSEATGIARSMLRPDLYPASDDATLKPARSSAGAVSPAQLERAGQIVIPGTERRSL